MWYGIVGSLQVSLYFFFFNDTATTEIYTLSLHDALPICRRSPRHGRRGRSPPLRAPGRARAAAAPPARDRKSTRLNSSHLVISYAVFCLKKKNPRITTPCSYRQIVVRSTYCNLGSPQRGR